MAKKKRSKGKRRGGKRRGKKSKASAKHSAALEASGLWDGYKVLTRDMGGQTLGRRLISAPFDPAQRQAINNPAWFKTVLREDTRELQAVLLFKVAQKIPVIKGPANKAASIINALGRQLGVKGKYKVI